LSLNELKYLNMNSSVKENYRDIGQTLLYVYGDNFYG